MNRQSLWWAVYTSGEGWSKPEPFADHLSARGAALAEVDGTVYCAHKGGGAPGFETPVMWTSFTPASVEPFVAPEWSPDAEVGVSSKLPPALVNDGGTLRLVHQVTVRDNGPHDELREVVLGVKGGAPAWSAPSGALKYRGSWPAAAAFDGKAHVVCCEGADEMIVHLVRGVDGKWAEAVDANGTVVKAPDVGETVGPSSLGVHEGKLHLLRSAWLTEETPEGREDEHRLWHAVFDGTAWSEGTLLPAVHASEYPPALASYDGRLHAVYSTPENVLRHTTWTAGDGWADGQEVEGRDSAELPALLVFRDGPAGKEHEALLLVNRGVRH
ncbi:hypothetical protein [Kitasatospora sp. MY 5-36]|uniref:hypothetical protein n=1 Tax=Kitasatospora sp. MY 5-36 TaxID=1678027 RepID=UPI00131D4553|nr:hypothetical protein [Kitasatospora sp. MY 5-36]